MKLSSQRKTFSCKQLDLLLILRRRILSNLIGNIKDQNQRNAIVEFASALDLAQKCDKATHIECLKQLYVIYGTEYIHVLSESKLNYDDYVITAKYPAKLNCSEGELLAEFSSCWLAIGKMRQKYKDTSCKATRMLRFWVHIVEEYCIEYPYLTKLVLILLSISPGTGPLERSYANTCLKQHTKFFRKRNRTKIYYSKGFIY